MVRVMTAEEEEKDDGDDVGIFFFSTNAYRMALSLRSESRNARRKEA